MKNIYTDNSYMELNPSWHAEDSPWKAEQIMRMLNRHPLELRSIAEVGCGVGGILVALHESFPPQTIEFHGFDIASEAITRAKEKQKDHLHFYATDIFKDGRHFDLLLVMDVIEHVPDYLGFLESCQQKADYKLYHIPLDLHASSVIRGTFVNGRKTVGHIQYFSAESALASLKDTGHTIIDFFYTDGAVGLAGLHPSLKRSLANIPRKSIAMISERWAARMLGGYSLMVLAR